MKKSTEYLESNHVDIDEINSLIMQIRISPIKKRAENVEQSISTMANLSRQAEGKRRDWNAPLPQSAKAVHPDDMKREISPEEFAIEDKRRKSSKNTHMQSEFGSASDERKEKAAHALVVTPPAKVTPEDEHRIVGLVELVSQSPQVLWKKLPWWKAIIHWLRGNEVKAEEAKLEGWKTND